MYSENDMTMNLKENKVKLKSIYFLAKRKTKY